MKNSTGFMFYLAGLSILGFLATDMYLPAFGAMQQDLNTSAGTISASLSIFLAGFALGQPLWGVLSDRLGRKPVLSLGLLMFAVGCLGMLWAQNQWQLWALRFIQAIGVCSASVTWQALVVDRYEASQAKRVFATIMPLVALSPALAPLMGAGVLAHIGWRAIFGLLMLITLALLLPTLLLKPSKKIDSHSEKKTSLGFYRLLSTRVYSGNVMMYAACSAGFFAWLTGSPFILGDMGYSPSDIGLSYVPQTLAFLIGGMGCRSALSRIDGKVLLPWLLLIYSVSMIAIYMVASLTTPTLTTLMIPFCAMAFANGASYPIMVSNALTPFPESTGKAAAMQNSLQLGLCFVASMVVSAYISQPLLATATVMLSTVVLALLGYYLQWHKRSNAPKQNITNVTQ